MRRILVLRGGALGDFIVTLPALLALRSMWPESQIELVGNATAAELARRRGLVDRVHSQHEARWAELFREQTTDDGEQSDLAHRLAEFDLVVNYWPDADGALRRKFPVRAGQRFVSAAAMPTRSPAAAHYVEALRELGVAAQSLFCRIEGDRIVWGDRMDIEIGGSLPSAAPRRQGREIPACNRAIAIHPGSGSATKNWPAERWRELIARLKAPVVLICGEAELESWRPISPSALGPDVRTVINPPLERLVDELRSCEWFLGHDSGVSHLAAACGVPSVLLFGPTDPARWAPPANHVRVIRHGDDLRAITVDEVAEAIQGPATESHENQRLRR